jgi:phage shock protein E
MKILLTAVLSLVLVACSSDNRVAMEAREAVEAGALLVDVRSAEEFATGHLPGALNIPHGEILAGIAELGVDKNAPIVLYCRSGNRSGIAQTALESAGYSKLMNAGGYSALKPTWDAASGG